MGQVGDGSNNVRSQEITAEEKALDLTRNYREHSDMTAQELTSQITTE